MILKIRQNFTSSRQLLIIELSGREIELNEITIKVLNNCSRFNGGINRGACVSLPRQVELGNSPFFFNQFYIHGQYFNLKLIKGQPLELSCKKMDDVHTWLYRTGDDPSTDDNEKMSDPVAIPLKSYNPDTKQMEPTALTDSEEKPKTTEITNFVNGHNQATLDIKADGFDNYMSLRCIDGSPTAQMVAEFKNKKGEVIATIGAAKRKGTRGVGKSDPDATVDMANISPQTMSIPGCGAKPVLAGSGTSSPSGPVTSGAIFLDMNRKKGVKIGSGN